MKKQKASYSFVDFNWLKIGRLIDHYQKKAPRERYTDLEIALYMKLMMDNYLSDTKNFKTIRSIIDFQYYTYAFKVQIVELFFVLCQILAF